MAKTQREEDSDVEGDLQLSNKETEDGNGADDSKIEQEEDGEGRTNKRKRKRKRKKKASDEKAEEKDGENQSSTQDSVECTVYVEGIPFDATPDQVKDFFASKGVIKDILELRLPTWQDSGRLRGYGHILFGSKESYHSALGLSGQHMGKRYLTIQPANAPRSNVTRPSRAISDGPPPTDCHTLFVNNLPYRAAEDEIAAAFESFGATISEDGVRIARNSVTRQSKGFCYIDFETPKDAQRVMKSTKNVVVGGRILRLDYDTGRMKGSYRAESGRLWTKESKEKKRARTN